MKTIATSLVLFLLGTQAYAQHGSNAYRELADSLYRHHHYQHAADYYEKALKKAPSPGYLMLQLGKCYDKINSPAVAELWFEKATRNRADFTDEDYYLFAEALIAQKKIWKADSLLESILESNPNMHLAAKALDDIRNMDKFYKDSASYKIVYLTLNTTVAEFSPAFYKEGIVFTAARQENALKKKYHWDNSHFLNLYLSSKKGDTFSEPQLFENDLNTRHHDGPAIFYDNFQKMIINRNQRVKVDGREDVYEWRPGLYDATFNADQSSWEVTPLPFNHQSYAFAHPSISEDGNVLYFASDKPGGYGGTDLYRVVRMNGTWGIPYNLGPSVNTIEDEAFPFFANNTLYFASTGHGGLGGLDIFTSDISPNGFTPPVNLGYPINSAADDFSLITDSLKTTGYYASSRKGNDDIYAYSKKEAKINLLAHIFDGETKQPLDGANIQIITNGGEDLTRTADTNGDFGFSIPKGISYIVIGSKDDRIGMISDLADSAMSHEIPAYRDTTSLACIGLIQDENGIPVTAEIITIKDSTSGIQIPHPGNQSIISFRGEKGHRYSIEALHALGGKATHDLEIAKNDQGTKRFTIVIPTQSDRLDLAGRVFRADDNSPLGGADVKILTFVDNDQELTTNTDGTIDFTLGRGTAYVVIASKDGLTGMHADIAEEGKQKEFIIHPIPAYGDKPNSVLGMGLITSTSGKPIGGYTATVTNKSTGEKIALQANKGVLTFLGEKGSDYNISVEHNDYKTQLIQVSIPSDGSHPYKFSIVLKEKDGIKDRANTNSIPLIAALTVPSTLLILDTEEGGSKAFISSKDSFNEISEKNGELILQRGNKKESIGKGTLAELKTDPTKILGSKGLSQVSSRNLRNIYFDFDKSTLDAEDEQRLEEVINVLHHVDSYNLTVAGHADDRGMENYNLRLSRRRSNAVTRYLESHGVPKERIIQKAYGESQLAVGCPDGNCSEENHKLNRRAEFLLKSNGATTPMVSVPDKNGSSSNEYGIILENFGEKQIDGLSFKVNIGAYKKNHALTFPSLNGLGKIESVTKNGVTYYFLTEFYTLKDAEDIRVQAVQRGVQGASISIYHHGDKINFSRFSSLAGAP